jgi:hypothetical protein
MQFNTCSSHKHSEMIDENVCLVQGRDSNHSWLPKGTAPGTDKQAAAADEPAAKLQKTDRVVLHITQFLRPFTLKQVKDLLEEVWNWAQ